MTRRIFDYRTIPRKRRMQILGCMVFYSILAGILFSRYVICGVEVVGISMKPTYSPGQRCILHKWYYHLYTPRRGDIIAFTLPKENDMTVKRIIAMPGDRVKIADGKVFVNGYQLKETYLDWNEYTHRGNLSDGEYRINEDAFFVLGDNRDESADSRYFGAIRKEWIHGVIAPRHKSIFSHAIVHAADTGQ